jgi:hypothetical protein
MDREAKIRVVLAFDHELSLGGAPDYNANLFEPTRQLLQLADDAGVRVVLFTDVLCAMAHERWGQTTFVERYRDSLKAALADGHDLQLHLHPHWLTSQFENGAFRPSRDFALANFDDLESVIRDGASYLRELGCEADPAYRCIAFRAGGYNMAPQTGRILRALYEEGIRIDSSIIKGFRFRSAISAIDFTGTTHRANWYVPLDGPINASSDHGMFEVPIASAPRTPVNNLPFLVRRVLHRKRKYSDGGRGIHDGVSSRSEKLKRMFPQSAWPLSFDNFADSAQDVFSVLRRHVEAHAGEEEIICATVSHPKSMGAHARNVMRGFIERARDEYGANVDFPTFAQLYAEMRARERKMPSYSAS